MYIVFSWIHASYIENQLRENMYTYFVQYYKREEIKV